MAILEKLLDTHPIYSKRIEKVYEHGNQIGKLMGKIDEITNGNEEVKKVLELMDDELDYMLINYEKVELLLLRYGKTVRKENVINDRCS